MIEPLMTVGELVNILKEFKQDLPITFADADKDNRLVLSVYYSGEESKQHVVVDITDGMEYD